MILLATSNVSPITYIASKIASYLIVLSVQLFYIFLLCYLMTGYVLELLNIMAIFIMILVGVSFWSVPGLILGITVKSELTRDLIFTLTGIPVVLTSTVYYPMEKGPIWFKFIAYINPLTYTADGIRDLFLVLPLRIEVIVVNLMMIVITMLTLTYVSKTIYYLK